jgi:hypothetical protein
MSIAQVRGVQLVSGRGAGGAAVAGAVRSVGEVMVAPSIQDF